MLSWWAICRSTAALALWFLVIREVMHPEMSNSGSYTMMEIRIPPRLFSRPPAPKSCLRSVGSWSGGSKNRGSLPTPRRRRTSSGMALCFMRCSTATEYLRCSLLVSGSRM